MQYTTYKKNIEDRLTQIFNENQVFFAFNEKQLKEGNKQNKKLVSFGAGGFLPKENYDNFSKQMDELEKSNQEKAKELNRDEVILYELCNHEAFYTGDIDSTMSALEEFGYTREQVKKVFNKNYNKYCE